MPELSITPQEAGIRLDQCLAERFPDYSRSKVQGWIKEGVVLVDGKPAKPSEKLRAGALVTLEIPETTAQSEQRPEAIPLDILYEDDFLAVINKEAGMVVHPAAGNAQGTLVNALLHHCKTLSRFGGEDRPGIVHRLDKETSGCMVIAKDDATHEKLAAQFAGRDVLKVYLAVATGRFKQSQGTLTNEMARHPIHRKKMAVVEAGSGKVAITDWRVLKELEAGTLVECTLHTGRTHQIRVHLKHLGHPLLGDEVYGKRGKFTRHLLHAWKLGFTHPATGERLTLIAPLPEIFETMEAVP